MQSCGLLNSNCDSLRLPSLPSKSGLMLFAAVQYDLTSDE